MKKTELLIMAAGMGSRFGGLKQIEPLGPNGESILDFSVYDAKKAGFDRAVIVIKKAIEKDFRETCGKRIEKMIDTEYVFQELDKLPSGFSVPEGRVKPWGTGHAVLCAKDAVKAPFAVINADDFYGFGAYKLIHGFLESNDGMCMVGYKLGNTITENGTVSRGVCEVENGILQSVTEHTAIDKDSGIPMDTVVSMNMWGFDTGIFPFLEKEFELFLKENKNEAKSEFFLPSAVTKRIHEQKRAAAVLETDEKWYGVTYREDADSVKRAMKEFVDKGMYKF
ncbi:MAG: sugar phosphate nucleotidyltransferase [Monoglobaceae bacterium]